MKDLLDSVFHSRMVRMIEGIQDGSTPVPDKQLLALTHCLEFAHLAYNDPAFLDVHQSEIVIDQRDVAGRRIRYLTYEHRGYTMLFKRIDYDDFLVLDFHSTMLRADIEAKVRSGGFD